MITEFWNFYKEAQRLGIPIDTIVLFILIGVVGLGSYKVIKYMIRDFRTTRASV